MTFIRTILATALLGCTLIGPLALAAGPRAAVPPAAAPTPSVSTHPWYLVNQMEKQCVVAIPSLGRIIQERDGLPDPALAMELYDTTAERYTMEDVTEQGEIVQTTMRVFPTKEQPSGIWLRWYRGLARCEQALRTQQQARERQRAKYQ